MTNEEKLRAWIIKRRPDIKKLVAGLFKDDKGEPFILSDGQCDIFSSIFFKEKFIEYGFNRVEIIAPTQYGKSNTIGIAVVASVAGLFLPKKKETRKKKKRSKSKFFTKRL